MRRYGWLLGLLLILPGCAERELLRPAYTAQLVPGQGTAAQEEVAGVRVMVNARRWTGFPDTLPDHIPVHVDIHNDSGKPLLVRYNAFELVSPAGEEAPALPPLALEGSVPAPVSQPDFLYDRFWVAPYYAPYYPGIWPWDTPFAYDPLYYRRYYGYWRAPLPTPDMLAKAIPDGVVADDGHLAGFLYFPEMRENTERVHFTVELIDAGTGETFGTIRIPFLLEET